MTTRRRRWDVLLSAALFLLLALLFVPECDDCYFIYWDFASWKDFLLVRPIPQEGVVLGVPSNGRYLGNLLGLILGKLAFSPLWPLRVLILGGGMLGLTLLLSRFFQGGPAGGRESFALALFLVVWAPWGIWQQVYSWSAAWANYLAPTLLLLPVLLLLRPGRPDRWPLVLLLSLSIGLFTEHNTAYLVLLSSAMALAGLVPALRGLLPAPSLRAALLAGSWAGLALSMTNSVFAQVDSGLRGVGLDLARDNLPVIFTEVLLRPIPLCLTISLLLLWLVRRQGCPRWRLWACLLLPLHLYIGYDRLLVVLKRRDLYREECLWLGLALALLWLILAVEWRGGADRRELWFWVASLLVVTGPMLVVSPVNARMFFSSYLFLCLAASVLFRRARAEGLRPLTRLNRAAAAAGVLLVAVYACNAAVWVHRLDTARAQADGGASQITLPLVPFPQFTANEMAGKGDIVYLVYHQQPWDISFTFVPYEDWAEG